ncbi:MAG TPA: hypothetical protein VF741_00155 [Candidatus Aquilonibacter sp.]
MSVPPVVEYLEALFGEEATRAAYRYLALLVVAVVVSALLYPFAWRGSVRTGIVVGLLLYAAIDLPRTFAHARARKQTSDNTFNRKGGKE